MKKNAAEDPQFDPIQRLNEVDSVIKIPADIELHIRRILRRNFVRKGALLLEMGAISDRIWFIESGLFRCYKKGREYLVHERE
jgi:CRP-like cAMP-binding protein